MFPQPFYTLSARCGSLDYKVKKDEDEEGNGKEGEE
jgi:hypothetical protein